MMRRLQAWYPWLLTWLSVAHFHLFWRWADYPRTFNEDWRRFVAYFRNPVLCRRDQSLAFTLLPISDPMSVPWDEIHDSIFMQWPLEDALCRKERQLKWNRRFLLVLYGALLKRTGDLVSAETLFRSMVAKNVGRYEGIVGAADILHLLANWRTELREYKAKSVYPERSILPPGGRDDDRLARIELFDLSDAILAYDQAIALRPEGVFAYVQKARALVDDNRPREASQLLAIARQYAPNNQLIRLKQSYLDGLVGDPTAFDRTRQVYEALPDIRWEFGDLKRVQLKSYRQVASLQRRQRRRFLPAERLSGAINVVHGGCASTYQFSIPYEQVDYGRLSNVRDLGFGLKLVDEKYLITNSKALPHSELKLFARSVIINDDTHALVGTRISSVNCNLYNAVMLPGVGYNYYHWIFDTLASILILSKTEDLAKFTFIVTDPLLPFQREALALAIPSPLNLHALPLPWPRFLFDEVLHLPYPARLNVPHPQAVQAVRRALSRHNPQAKRGKWIYITRARVVGRRALNEIEITKMLAERGFEIFDPSNVTLADQIEFFRDVEIVVTPAGAALTNLVFCPRQTRVVISTSDNHNFETFTALVGALGLETWCCLGRGVTQPNPYFVWSIFEMLVDPIDLAQCVDAAISSVSKEASLVQ